VDRTRADGAIRAGLWAATFAVGMFALAFFVAIAYIA
jgi:hypothetical protein